MHPVEVKAALERAVLICDTREQDTPRLRARLQQVGLPVERRKLDFGDYSISCPALSLEGVVSIERKMDLSELCGCYCNSRARFTREFERAKLVGGKIYLLIEDASWESVYNGKYRSRMTPQALVASILAWLARYDCRLIFCKQETSGRLIRDILYRELKERLEALPVEENSIDERKIN